MKTFWDWFYREENEKSRNEWEPVPLELPIDDPSMIMPPTTSSKDEDRDASEDSTTISFEL